MTYFFKVEHFSGVYIIRVLKIIFIFVFIYRENIVKSGPKCACYAPSTCAVQVRFGPDVEWLSKSAAAAAVALGEEDGFDYRVDPNRSMAFGDAIRR